jgi:hypothetical protein
MSFNHLQRRRQILDILFLYGAIMVIIVKRWPHVSKKDVTGKLAEALKPNLFKEL